MAISGIAAAGLSVASQPAMQSPSQHKHGGHHSHALSDIDAQGSSIASAPSSSGKVGSRVDLTA